MRKCIVALLAGAMLMMATSAMATMYDFYFTGGVGPTYLTYDMTGRFDTTILGGNIVATSGDLTFTGTAYHGETFTLVPLPDGVLQSSKRFYGGDDIYFDNIIVPGARTVLPVADAGLMLENLNHSSDSIYFALSNDGKGYVLYDRPLYGYGYQLIGGTATVIATPEPGTMMLLGIGMLGLAVYGKRRMNKEA